MSSILTDVLKSSLNSVSAATSASSTSSEAASGLPDASPVALPAAPIPVSARLSGERSAFQPFAASPRTRFPSFVSPKTTSGDNLSLQVSLTSFSGSPVAAGGSPTVSEASSVGHSASVGGSPSAWSSLSLTPFSADFGISPSHFHLTNVKSSGKGSVVSASPIGASPIIDASPISFGAPLHHLASSPVSAASDASVASTPTSMCSPLASPLFSPVSASPSPSHLPLCSPVLIKRDLGIGDSKSNRDTPRGGLTPSPLFMPSPSARLSDLPSTHFFRTSSLSKDAIAEHNKRSQDDVLTYELEKHFDSTNSRLSSQMLLMTKNMARPIFWVKTLRLLYKDGSLRKKIDDSLNYYNDEVQKIRSQLFIEQKKAMLEFLPKFLAGYQKYRGIFQNEFSRYVINNADVLLQRPSPDISIDARDGYSFAPVLEEMWGDFFKSFKTVEDNVSVKELVQIKKDLGWHQHLFKVTSGELRTLSDNVSNIYMDMYYSMRTVTHAATGNSNDFDPEKFPLHHVASSLFSEMRNVEAFGAINPNDPNSERHFEKCSVICERLNRDQYSLTQIITSFRLLRDKKRASQNATGISLTSGEFEEAIEVLQGLRADMNVHQHILLVALKQRSKRLATLPKDKQTKERERAHKKDQELLAMSKESRIEINVLKEIHYPIYFEAFLSKLYITNLLNVLKNKLKTLSRGKEQSNLLSTIKNFEAQKMRIDEIIGFFQNSSFVSVEACTKRMKELWQQNPKGAIKALKQFREAALAEYPKISNADAAGLVHFLKKFDFKNPSLLKYLNGEYYVDHVFTPELPSQVICCGYRELHELQARMNTNRFFGGVYDQLYPNESVNLRAIAWEYVQKSVGVRDDIMSMMLPIKDKKFDPSYHDRGQYYEDNMNPLDALPYTKTARLLLSAIIKNTKNNLSTAIEREMNANEKRALSDGDTKRLKEPTQGVLLFSSKPSKTSKPSRKQIKDTVKYRAVQWTILYSQFTATALQCIQVDEALRKQNITPVKPVPVKPSAASADLNPAKP